jgi:type IX secretion system PorP/SprF family membrane protein
LLSGGLRRAIQEPTFNRNKIVMNIKFIILFLFAGVIAQAQTLPQFSLRQQEMNLFNPAFVGSELYHRFQFHHRSQWVGFDGAPRTQIASYSGSFFKSVGLGGYIFYDVVGPSKNYGVNAAYAFHLKLKKSSVSFGLSTTISQFGYDTNQLELQSEMDPVVAEKEILKSKIAPGFTGGVLWYSKNYFLGISANVNLGAEAKVDVNFNIPSMQYYYLLAGYSFIFMNNDFIMTPNLLVIGSSDGNYQFDAGARAELYNSVIFGLMYRTDKSIVASAGLKLNHTFELHYAYDFTYANIGEYHKSSHEIVVAYKFGKSNYPVFKEGSNKGVKKYSWQ